MKIKKNMLFSWGSGGEIKKNNFILYCVASSVKDLLEKI